MTLLEHTITELQEKETADVTSLCEKGSFCFLDNIYTMAYKAAQGIHCTWTRST